MALNHHQTYKKVKLFMRVWPVECIQAAYLRGKEGELVYIGPYAKKCACNMHVPTNYMHVMVNMHVTLMLHECYMHVKRVLEMVALVSCMLYEC